MEDILRLGHTEALARGMFFGATGMTGNFIMLSVLWYVTFDNTRGTFTVDGWLPHGAALFLRVVMAVA